MLSNTNTSLGNLYAWDVSPRAAWGTHEVREETKTRVTVNEGSEEKPAAPSKAAAQGPMEDSTKVLMVALLSGAGQLLWGPGAYSCLTRCLRLRIPQSGPGDQTEPNLSLV